MISSFREERAGLCASRVIVCFARVKFCPFSLPLGIGGWLRLVPVTLPGLFFVTENYTYETKSMTCILEQLKWESPKTGAIVDL